MNRVAGKAKVPTVRSTSRHRILRQLIPALLIAGLLCVGSLYAQLPVRSSTPFTVVGFIQAATMDTPGDIWSGGQLTVNGHLIIIPRNTILQMPAFALTWAELFSLAPAPYGLGSGAGGAAQSGLALSDVPVPLTTYEAIVYGNRIIDRIKGTDQYIAGLVFLSQQSLNAGQGHINYIDYAKGELRVGGIINDPNCVAGAAACTGARVQINDPLGRFGLAHSPDVRFTIDEDNPTVHARSGYPMCIPRVAPPAIDPLCPTNNRPVDPLSGTYQTIFTFPDPTPRIIGVDPVTNAVLSVPPTSPTDPPDATRQMPFEVGDYVTFNGTLVKDPACTAASGCPTLISAWSTIADIGAFTFPGVMPAYVSIEVMLLGVAGDPDPLLPQEAVEKLVFIGFTTDSTSLIDAWAIDKDNCTGGQNDRYYSTMSPFGPPVGALKGRFKMRATVGSFLPATREMRAVSRTLTGGGLTAGFFNRPGPPQFPGDPVPPGMHTYANGLLAGQYHAPNFTFIFPENLIVGSPQVPLNFQDFGFLVNGEGPYFPADPATFGAGPFPSGQLTPWPGNSNVPFGCGPGNVTKMPIPSAGAPQTVGSGVVVTLDGSGSVDPNTPPLPLTFDWVQVSGPAVTLSSTTAAKPTFTAPIVAAGTPAVQLAFQMSVNNGIGSSGIASTFVNVSPVNAPPPPAPTTDIVTITSAIYRISKSQLIVTAVTSDNTGAAVLTLNIPNRLPIVMTNQPPLCLPACAPNTYIGRWVGVNPIPDSVTVTSSEGGRATSFITRIR
ncbi:MAG: hypothetical protein LAO21_23155 [Acidobacteriia bacterium]|nr:hypothetical protein [Terriglobia bacterium]